MPTINELIDKAKGKLSNLTSGEVFLLRDLFKVYEWDRNSCSERLLLCTLFLSFIKQNFIKVAPIEKTSLGQHRYQIINQVEGRR